jgi:hypothetical protein
MGRSLLNGGGYSLRSGWPPQLVVPQLLSEHTVAAAADLAGCPKHQGEVF